MGVCEGTVGLGHCLGASDLKNLLFSMLPNVMKKVKISSISWRRQTGYVMSQLPFFISEHQMQVSKHTDSHLQCFSGMAN